MQQQPAPSKQSKPPKRQALPCKQPTRPQKQAGPQLFEPSEKLLVSIEEGITSSVHYVIRNHLSEILRSSKESWQHKIFNGHIFSEGKPIERNDLKFNVSFTDRVKSNLFHG